MCRARSGKRKVRKTIARAQRELLRYHEATARFNAAIRNTYPRQHRIAKSMERHSSGLINDAPEEIQSFVGAAEDACYFCSPRQASAGAWGDGVAETIDAARACVGCPRLGAYGDRVYPMAVTWVEKALASEMRAAACQVAYHSVHPLTNTRGASLTCPAASKFGRLWTSTRRANSTWPVASTLGRHWTSTRRARLTCPAASNLGRLRTSTRRANSNK